MDSYTIRAVSGMAGTAFNSFLKYREFRMKSDDYARKKERHEQDMRSSTVNLSQSIKRHEGSMREMEQKTWMSQIKAQSEYGKLTEMMKKGRARDESSFDMQPDRMAVEEDLFNSSLTGEGFNMSTSQDYIDRLSSM